MRAVFLNSSGARKESAGTGVFLPGTAGNKLAPRKKTGKCAARQESPLGFSCRRASVFLFCRIWQSSQRVGHQVLNLRLEDFAAQPRFPGGFVLTHGNCFPCAVLSACQSAVISHEKKNRPLNAQPPAAVAEAAAHEIGLPHDWSY
ncbi:hypothetical protein B296_00038502 [Ensete ventricosum]|uniref:Uncharacterized protein n=1 Tax=Ensete ventricosum TaxID=4639 RepID=A0A426ZW71_ENSVE|nr:hypothetical protein B296_00038502 [Ensete ventricosum]